MPVVLERSDLDAWMRAETPAERLHEMLWPFPKGRPGVHEVDRRVGKSSKNDERPIVRAA